MQKYINFEYDANTVTQKVFIIPRNLRLVGIRGVTRVAGSGGACTFSFYKSASEVAVASGTLLHDGTFNLAGTADTNQTMTLVSNSSGALDFVSGDSIGLALSGTPTSAVGCVQFTFEPM
jgi:hypothetical protein